MLEPEDVPDDDSLDVAEEADPAQCYTIAEVARFFRVSEKSIRRMIWSGRLVSVRHGRRVLIRRSDVMLYLNAVTMVVTPDGVKPVNPEEYVLMLKRAGQPIPKEFQDFSDDPPH